MKTLLIIGQVWPEPTSSAAGMRMIQLLRFFKNQHYQITFASPASKTPYSENLGPWSIQEVKVSLNCNSFDELVSDLQPELVLYDRFMMEEQFGWRVRETCPEAIQILDTEDLHFLRQFRQQEVQSSSTPPRSDLAKREIASIYRCDLSLIISEYEMKLLQQTYQVPKELLVYLPFLSELPSEETRTHLPGFDQRRHMISIGNFLHAPNKDAVFQIKKELWSNIRKAMPEVEIHIYGAYANQEILQWDDPKNGFLIKGRAGNALEVLKQYRLVLAPIRFGAGLKGKFMDAMQSGTPSVTTPVGAEAMAGKMDWGGTIAASSEKMIEAAISLYQNQKQWRLAQEKGFRILAQRFSRKDFEGVLLERLNFLKANIGAHRKANFIGSMLQHHHLNATKHLSRYIEIKNKWKEVDKS